MYPKYHFTTVGFWRHFHMLHHLRHSRWLTLANNLECIKFLGCIQNPANNGITYPYLWTGDRRISEPSGCMCGWYHYHSCFLWKLSCSKNATMPWPHPKEYKKQWRLSVRSIHPCGRNSEKRRLYRRFKGRTRSFFCCGQMHLYIYIILW